LQVGGKIRSLGAKAPRDDKIEALCGAAEAAPFQNTQVMSFPQSARDFNHLERYNRANDMKAFVYVTLKKSVLDPQGKTIQGALKKLGYGSVSDVRQGKYFELQLDGGLDKAGAQAQVEKIAREVLTNPVIEEFTYSIEG
jgi:phosphoribosylformylglycinamidine synthase PurS subunit